MSEIKTFVSRDSATMQLGTLIRILRLSVVLAVFTMVGVLAQAQDNFSVIYSLSWGSGAAPSSAPILGGHRNLYGTTYEGGIWGYGNIYQLTRVNGSWVWNTLYTFKGYGDGGRPYAGVTIGPDGTFFGTTTLGGANGYGTLFDIKPSAALVCTNAVCPWKETTLYSFPFTFSTQGTTSNVVFDSQGSMYGTTQGDGTYGEGTAYKATLSGGTWNVSVIYNFGTSPNDGNTPSGGLVVDNAGNLYGTTEIGGASQSGTAFELSPSQGGWTETILHSFNCYPQAGLVFDHAGNLYGGTTGGYGGCGGTVFELSPQDGSWNFSTIHNFSGSGPESTLAIDDAGNLYGTTPRGGSSGNGNVFEVSPSNGGGWTYTDIYDFTNGNDGQWPIGGVIVNPGDGYLYGTTNHGGSGGGGVIYQINLGAR